MYNILLFDLDGTLTDPKIGITKSVNYALQKFGREVDDLDQLIPFIGPPLLDSFIQYCGLTDEQAHQAIDYYREYFSVTGLYENAVFPGIKSLLAELVRQQKRLFVATSKPTDCSERILAHFGLTAYFERVVGSNLDGTRVNKAEVIAAVLSEIPLANRHQTLMIGDRLHDILGAKTCGLDSIGVAYGYGGTQELSQAGATYIVNTVAELNRFLLER